MSNHEKGGEQDVVSTAQFLKLLFGTAAVAGTAAAGAWEKRRLHYRHTGELVTRNDALAILESDGQAGMHIRQLGAAAALFSEGATSKELRAVILGGKRGVMSVGLAFAELEKKGLAMSQVVENDKSPRIMMTPAFYHGLYEKTRLPGQEVYDPASLPKFTAQLTAYYNQENVGHELAPAEVISLLAVPPSRNQT